MLGLHSHGWRRNEQPSARELPYPRWVRCIRRWFDVVFRMVALLLWHPCIQFDTCPYKAWLMLARAWVSQHIVNTTKPTRAANEHRVHPCFRRFVEHEEENQRVDRE